MGRRQRRCRHARHDRRRRHEPQGHPLSRRNLRQLRWLQGPQCAIAADRQRRTALRDRTERCGQDDHDGRDHRQDASRHRHCVLRPDHRPDTSERARNRRSRHRAQVPEADSVFAAHGVRESRARAQGRQARLADVARASRHPGARSQPRRWRRSSCTARRAAWRGCCRTARSNGSRSACC